MVLMWKHEGNRTLGKPTRRWKGLKEINLKYTKWIDLLHDGDRWRACVNTVMNLCVP